MKGLAVRLLVLALVLNACSRSDPGFSAGAGGGSGGAGEISCTPDGVRLCGDPCAPIGFPECGGVGCTAVVDRVSGAQLDLGVCFPDVEAWFDNTCTACLRDDDVCVHRGPDELICVPEEVCVSLYAFGAGRACRYQDKTAYDGALIPNELPCPDATRDVLCGGTCGDDCGDIFGSIACVGRSPTRPFGICSRRVANGPLACAKNADGTMRWLCFGDAACSIFDNPGDQLIADAFGVCVERETCLRAAGLVPGVGCYAEDGSRLN